VTPDYSRYSKAELEEALRTIDKARFPERVEKILQALASLEANEDDSPAPEQEILLPEPETPEQIQRKLLGTLALICGGLILGAMLLPVYFHSFLLNNEMVTPFKWVALTAGLVVFVVTCKKFLHTNHLRKMSAERLAKGKKQVKVDSPRRFYNAIGAALLVALFTALAVYRGAPVALHLYVLDASTATEQVTIAKLPRRFRRKHCNGKIYLAEYSAQFFDYVCQVTTRSQWERLRPGQQIRLHGSRSALGFLARDTSL
tara:strand:+ start:750 stop:1526 length:777 start_codon:yes stop_codon:yes gene_type:complete